MKKFLLLTMVAAIAVTLFFLSAFVAAVYRVFGLVGLILTLIFLAAFAVGLVKLVKVIRRRCVSRKGPETVQPAAKPEAAASVKPSAEVSLRSSIEYTDVRLYAPPGAVGPKPPIGCQIFFCEDPANPYDSEAIKAVWYDVDGSEIVAGWMNKGKLREMVRDWLNRYDEYECVVTDNSLPKNVIVDLTMYR